MKLLEVGGVPEHFNVPWRQLEASPQPVPFRWHDVPGGTGAMVAALREGMLDVAVMLTEGAVAAHVAGAPFEIVSAYTQSPLLWGIHVPARAESRVEADIRGLRYAISRPGSGSHLMAFAHARRHDWPLKALRFVEVGSLDGARAAFRERRADVFFWEKFMTKPLVERGEFRRVGEFAADWPAFVMCVREDVLRESGPRIVTLIEAALAQARTFAAARESVPLIAERFGLSAADAREWLGLTRWPPSIGIDSAMLEHVADVLADAGVPGAHS